MKGRLQLSYVLTLCLAFILALAMPSMAYVGSEKTEQWVARYSGPGNGTDRTNAIAVDTWGNVYVTGVSDGGTATYNDYATVKYDTDGNQLWVARYDSSASYSDEAVAVAVDTWGNVYVTGVSDGGTATYNDYATVKYDTDGNQLWVARYNGPESVADEAVAVAVDAWGNVYVTGHSYSSWTDTDCDYATVKYDTNGNQLWVARYNSSANDSDEAYAMAVDAWGNVYVTGRSYGSGTGYDYATLKYDTNGNQLWVKRYNGPGNGTDNAYAITVDPSGNAYVTGSSQGSGTSFDYATLKYDTNGNQLWVKQYNGLGNKSDEAKAIVVDAWGNVYVTGQSIGTATYSDYATVKYDSNGNQLWVKRYDGPGNKSDGANAIAIDASGNAYVTGNSWSGTASTSSDYATVKYDTDGNQLWVKRYNSLGNGFDEANAIAIDTSGNIYVTGWSDGITGTGYDYATIKYNPPEEWVARYNGPENTFDEANAIAVDAWGNVYVTGESCSSGTDTDCDYATVKYDTHGNQLWVARYNGRGNGFDEANAIAIDTLGNVYVTGRSDGISGTGRDYATVKYDTHGNQLWVKRYNGPGNKSDGANAISVDAWGNVYVTGESIGTGTYADYATVKYDSNGNQLWVKRYDGPENGYDWAEAMVVDASGNVYVTGWSVGPGHFDYATVKYASNGKQLWVARYNGPENSNDGANAMAVDASGSIYVTGESYGMMTERDYTTVKYDIHGNQLWVKRYNGPKNGYDSPKAIAVDASGNVYVTGKSEGDETDEDYATVKYDTDGNQLWVTRYNGPGNKIDQARAIAVDAWGNVYVTGWSNDLVVYEDLGAYYYYYDYATVKYDADGFELWVARYDGPISPRNDRANAIVLDTLGNVYVTGVSLGDGTGTDYATVKYGKVEEVKVTMELPAEWSMISLPVRPDVPTVATIFPDAVVVYKYQKGAGYVRVKAGEELQVGMGYWILLDKPQPYVMEGAEVTEYTIEVADGWYMIGGCSMPAQKMVTSGKIDVIYGYTQGKGYTRVPESQPLERGKGYWILFSNTSEGAGFTASTSFSE